MLRSRRTATLAHRRGSGTHFVVVTVVRVRAVRVPARGKPGNSPPAPAGATTMGHRCCSAGPGNRNHGPWMSCPQQRWPIDAVTRPGRTASMAHRCGSPRGYARFAVAADQPLAAPGGQRTRGRASAGDLPILRLVRAYCPRSTGRDLTQHRWDIDVVRRAARTRQGRKSPARRFCSPAGGDGWCWCYLSAVFAAGRRPGGWSTRSPRVAGSPEDSTLRRAPTPALCRSGVRRAARVTLVTLGTAVIECRRVRLSSRYANPD